METLLELDKKLFLALNSYHNPWLDQMMYFLTGTTAWIPLYLILAYLIIKTYGKETWLILLAIAVTIVLSDQITSTIMKPFFSRFRPSHEPSLQGLVNIVSNYRGGAYGFASSHAASTFGVATIVWLVLKSYRPWVGLLFLWAIFVGYTRIYLGVHYPSEILVGDLVGFETALALYYLYIYTKNLLNKRKTPSALGLIIFLYIFL
jgi:undecaprenyl-diphosphatase